MQENSLFLFEKKIFVEEKESEWMGDDAHMHTQNIYILNLKNTEF